MSASEPACRKISSSIISLSLLCLLLQSPLVSAEDEEEAESGRVIWGLDGGFVQQFSTDLKDNEGAFSVSRGFIQPSVGYAWNRRNRVSLSFDYGESNYDFSSAASVDGYAPWGRIRNYQLALPIRFSPGERTDVFLRPAIRSYAEKGANVSDGQTEGLIAGVSWVISERLVLGPGIGWYSKLGGGSFAFPIVIIDWAITEQLSLTTGRGLAASVGPGLTLNYRLSDKWRIGLTGRIERTRFALEDNASAELSPAFGKDRSMPLIFSLDYTPWQRTSVSVLAGFEMDGQLSLLDEAGDSLVRSDYEAPLLIGVVFSSRF